MMYKIFLAIALVLGGVFFGNLIPDTSNDLLFVAPSNPDHPLDDGNDMIWTVSPEAGGASQLFEKYRGQDVERISTDKKIMALTFDGGGNDDSVDKILDILSENSIKSTFFLTGKFVEKFPKAVEKINKSGHEIANHTHSHKNFTELSDDEAIEEISRMKTAAEKIGVAVAPFFRFPYGAYKKENIVLVNSLGYASVRWTIDSLGWRGKIGTHDAKFVTDRVVGKAMPGAIVLMHLGSAQDKSTLDVDALPDIIKTIDAQGYQFVTLSELFTSALRSRNPN